jgi:hypothetical protein
MSQENVELVQSRFSRVAEVDPLIPFQSSRLEATPCRAVRDLAAVPSPRRRSRLATVCKPFAVGFAHCRSETRISL